MRLLLRVVGFALLLLVGGCSAADVADETSSSLTTTGATSETTESLFPETPETTIGAASDSLAFQDPVFEDPALENSGIEVLEYRDPVDPEAPDCQAARSVLFDPAIQVMDNRSREIALLDASNDLLGEGKADWLAVRDVIIGQIDDLEERFATMQSATELRNQLNRITWERCGFPMLDVDQLMTTGMACFAMPCDEDAVWAETVPCFEPSRLTIDLFGDVDEAPEMILVEELYSPIDCSTREAIELDRDGRWVQRLTLEERMRLTSVWVVDTEIPAGTPAMQALADGHIVVDDIDIDLHRVEMIVAPEVELFGLVAARDLAVLSGQVVDSAHGCAVDSGVVPVMVVDVDEVVQCSGAFFI